MLTKFAEVIYNERFPETLIPHNTAIYIIIIIDYCVCGVVFVVFRGAGQIMSANVCKPFFNTSNMLVCARVRVYRLNSVNSTVENTPVVLYMYMYTSGL